VRVSWLEGDAARALEPALRCAAALDSPDSGIVDVPEYVAALCGDIEGQGGTLVYRTQVRTVRREGGVFVLTTADGDSLRCRVLINAAGLGAPGLARGIDGLDPALVPRLHYAQGHYYNLRGRCPFGRLIYPLPHDSGLGVHLGMDISGRCRFGPDVRWIPEPDYRFDDSLRAQFAASIREWWPALRDEDLMPDFVGVRPKLRGHGEHSADFLVQGSAQHGIDGLVNLFGIDSPGLTSSLALAEVVAPLV
jgi:L-2-hydroxyglutarate oxidase LhgO